MYWLLMSFPASESDFELPVQQQTDVELSAHPSRLEEEVTGLFRQLRNPLLRYLLAFGLLEHYGEEIIQEVFLALFRHLKLGKSRRNLRGWVFRVAHNLGLKRRVAVRQERHEATNDQRCDPALNPEQQLASMQRQQLLRAVFNALAEPDQCCLLLRAEGLRYREIAQVLNISLGAVSISLARSVDRLERASSP